MLIFLGLSRKFEMKALFVACGADVGPAEVLFGDKPVWIKTARHNNVLWLIVSKS